ncbi:MAG: hypothetical protein ABUS56_11430 [Acidobacteriota bacterium]
MGRILRGLGSRRLPCECVVGIYETYEGGTVALVDVRGPDCPDPRHRTNAAIALGAPVGPKAGPEARPLQAVPDGAARHPVSSA